MKEIEIQIEIELEPACPSVIEERDEGGNLKLPACRPQYFLCCGRRELEIQIDPDNYRDEIQIQIQIEIDIGSTFLESRTKNQESRVKINY